MFTIHCHHCDRQYLLGSGSIASLHNTSEGPVGYVTCPAGHRLIRYFRPAEKREQPVMRAAS